MSRLLVRVTSPWFGQLDTEDAHFSVDIPAEKADALLCEWWPAEELLSFPRRKAWYCIEPYCQFSGLGSGLFPRMLARLKPVEFLWHGHPDERYRVPHITHFQDLSVNKQTDRIMGCVAVVSNHGGSPWRRHPDLSYRARFVVHPLVDLFGRRGWERFRAGRFTREHTPPNYRGELPGDWPEPAKRALLARYKVCVCLENMLESYYFSEKFLEVVCAGCIPIYRAHPTVAETFLRGAAWIDPIDYGNDPDRTIAAALAADIEAFQEINERWLSNCLPLANTHRTAVFTQIGRILSNA